MVFSLPLTNYLFHVIFAVNSISANSTSSDRFFPFDGFAKCHIARHECPNKNITFHLYTRWDSSSISKSLRGTDAFFNRESQLESYQLDVASPETIKKAEFLKDSPLIILIHGYTGHKDFSPNTEIRPGKWQFYNKLKIKTLSLVFQTKAYLKHGNYNIISVDYHPLAPEPCYVQAVQNLPTVANCTAQLIDYLIKESIFLLDSIHVIGFVKPHRI